MGLSHAPRVITDGIVLALDAANTRSYVGSGTTWTDLIGSNNGTLNGPVFTQEPKLEPFGGAGAVQFDGTGDSLTLPNNTSIAFGSGEFTFEFWLFRNASSLFTILDTRALGQNPSGQITVFINSNGEIQVNEAGVVRLTGGSTTINTWNHYALVRDSSNVVTGYINGVSVGTWNTSLNFVLGSAPRIGSTVNNTYYLDGYISNLRIIKGTALYTSNFTPPRKKLEVTSDTVLLTCEKGTIRDRSPSAHAITINGDAKSISGASYFEFDGTDDEVSISSYQLSTTNSSAPYTLSAWINRTGSTTDGGIITQYVTGSSAVDRFGLREQNSKLSWWKGGSDLAISTNNIPTNVWKYIVGVKRSDNSVSIYIDGIEVGTGTDNLDFENATLKIGRFGTIAPFSGNISQVSIYNRALTAAEVTQNYNALRGRYGI